MEKSTEDKYPGAVIFKKLSISAVVEKKIEFRVRRFFLALELIFFIALTS